MWQRNVGSICAAACSLAHPFSLLHTIPPVSCVFSIFGQGSCELFPFEAVMIRAAMNILGHVFPPEYLRLRVELLDWHIFNSACKFTDGFPEGFLQQQMRVPIAPHPCWHSYYLPLNFSVSPGGVGWDMRRNLFMVLYLLIFFPHSLQKWEHSIKA